MSYSPTMSRNSAFLTLACALTQLALYIPTAQAQSVPGSAVVPAPKVVDVGAQLRQQEERERLNREKQEKRPDASLPAAKPAELSVIPGNETPCFPIDHVVLTGEMSAQFMWLIESSPIFGNKTGAMSGPMAGPKGEDSPLFGVSGKCLGVQGIDVVLRRLQNALIDKGYVTTRVLATPQDLKTRTLNLTLVPGRIRAIRLTPDSTSERATLWNALPMKVGDLLNLRDIEQALDNFKRSPTVQADIQIAPAESDLMGDSQGKAAPALPGQSDLVISYKQALPFRVNASVDDTGSRTTGKHIASFTVSYDNPLTLNDSLYVTATHDLGHGLRSIIDGGSNAIFSGTPPGQRGNSSETVHYDVPYGYWLLGATASQSRYNQTVAGFAQDSIYAGHSENVEVKLSRLIYRDTNHKTTVSLRGFRKSSTNLIDDTEVPNQKRITAGWELALGDRYLFKTGLDEDRQGSIDATIAFRQGTGAFGAIPAAEEAFGEGTSRYKLTTLDVTAQLPITLDKQKLLYTSQIKVQYNSVPFRHGDRLTSPDQFAIGGRYSVRGFSGDSSLTGDKGILWRNELDWTADSLGLKDQTLYLGLDAGHVGGISAQSQVGRNLAGAVLGMKGSFFPGSASYQGAQYDLFIASPVYKPAGFQSPKLTGGFSVGYSF